MITGTLRAHGLAQRGKVLARRAAWYAQSLPTFSRFAEVLCYST
jgi:hypothetical protein